MIDPSRANLRRGVARIARMTLCVAVGGLALLIWARLRLVTGVPRTALADPHSQVDHAPSPKQARATPPLAPREERASVPGESR
jgi:hypothetical protein